MTLVASIYVLMILLLPHLLTYCSKKKKPARPSSSTTIASTVSKPIEVTPSPSVDQAVVSVSKGTASASPSPSPAEFAANGDLATKWNLKKEDAPESEEKTDLRSLEENNPLSRKKLMEKRLKREKEKQRKKEEEMALKTPVTIDPQPEAKPLDKPKLATAEPTKPNEDRQIRKPMKQGSLTKVRSQRTQSRRRTITAVNENAVNPADSKKKPPAEPAPVKSSKSITNVRTQPRKGGQPNGKKMSRRSNDSLARKNGLPKSGRSKETDSSDDDSINESSTQKSLLKPVLGAPPPPAAKDNKDSGSGTPNRSASVESPGQSPATSGDSSSKHLKSLIPPGPMLTTRSSYGAPLPPRPIGPVINSYMERPKLLNHGALNKTAETKSSIMLPRNSSMVSKMGAARGASYMAFPKKNPNEATARMSSILTNSGIEQRSMAHPQKLDMRTASLAQDTNNLKSAIVTLKPPP